MKARRALLRRAAARELHDVFLPEESALELVSDSPKLAPKTPDEVHGRLHKAFRDLEAERRRDVARIGRWSCGYMDEADWDGWIFDKLEAGFAPLPQDHIPRYLRWTMEA